MFNDIVTFVVALVVYLITCAASAGFCVNVVYLCYPFRTILRKIFLIDVYCTQTSASVYVCLSGTESRVYNFSSTCFQPIDVCVESGVLDTYVLIFGCMNDRAVVNLNRKLLVEAYFKAYVNYIL